MVEFAVARSAYRVPPHLIDPEGGLRPLDLTWVTALAQLFTVDGQEDPIEIYPKANGRFGITAGRHRLAAALVLGWDFIDAFIDPEKRRREISENLFKLGLTPLARAAFVAELIDLARADAGVPKDTTMQSVAATARWSDRIGSEADDASRIVRFAFGFADDLAEKVGLSRASIYRDLELHRGLKPDVVEAIRGKPVASNASQLRKLARLPEGQQREVAGMIAEDTAKGVTDALAMLSQKTVPTARDKAWAALTSSWGRLGGVDRKEALRQFGEAGLPAGVTIIIDGVTFGGAK